MRSSAGKRREESCGSAHSHRSTRLPQSVPHSRDDHLRPPTQLLRVHPHHHPPELGEPFHPLDVPRALTFVRPVMFAVVLDEPLPPPPAQVRTGEDAAAAILDRYLCLRCGQPSTDQDEASACLRWGFGTGIHQRHDVTQRRESTFAPMASGHRGNLRRASGVVAEGVEDLDGAINGQPSAQVEGCRAGVVTSISPTRHTPSGRRASARTSMPSTDRRLPRRMSVADSPTPIHRVPCTAAAEKPASTASPSPVTLFTVLHRRATVARPGMTPCPCLSHDPGGGVAGCGGVDGPLIGTRPTEIG